MKSDFNGIIVGKNNVNSYSVKVNGTDRVTVRNRATLRKILPPVPIHNFESVQDMRPVLSFPSAEPAGSRDLGRHQAGPPGFVERAGLRSGDRSSNNIVVSGDTARSRVVYQLVLLGLLVVTHRVVVDLGGWAVRTG